MSVHSFAMGFTMPNYPLYVRLLGANSSEFGLLVFLKMTALFLTMIPGGWLTDNVGPKRTLLTSGFMSVGGWFILNVAPTWQWVGLYSLLSGAAWGIATGAWYVILANENPTHDGTPSVSAFAVGILSFILPDGLGSLTSMGFFKLVGDVYTRPILSMTFKLGILCSFVAFGFYLLLKSPEPTETIERKVGSFWGLFSKKNVGFLGFLLSNLFLGLGIGMIIDFSPLYFVERFQITPSMNSLIRALSSLVMTGATLAAPLVAKRVGPVATICVTQSLVVPPLLLLVLERTHLWRATTAFLVFRAFEHMFVPIFSSLAMHTLDAENRGKGGSLLDLFWSGGYLITPPVSGAWIQTHGFAPSFYFTAVSYILAAIIVYTTARWQKLTLRTKATAPPVITPKV